MKEHFITASKVVNRHVVLVGLVGLFNVSFFSGAMAYVSMAALILSFFVVIVVNGKIAQRIEQKNEKAAFHIVRDNWKNYLIAFLVIGAPVFLFNYLIEFASLSAETHILLKEAAKATMWVITIYVMPIVFIKRLGLMSVFAGISYFFSHVRQSFQIATFVVAMFVINTGGYLWAIEQIQNGVDVSSILLVMVTLNMASTYLSFIVFAAATNVLVQVDASIQGGNKNA